MPAMPPVITTNNSLRVRLRQIGPDEQRRLDHAEEDVGRGREPDRAADAERALEQPGKAAHDRRQDAPIEQQRGEHAHHQQRPARPAAPARIPRRGLSARRAGGRRRDSRTRRRCRPWSRRRWRRRRLLTTAKAAVTCGTLMRTSAVTKVAASPMPACRNDTARRFSLIAQAMARSAKTPNADCSENRHAH